MQIKRYTWVFLALLLLSSCSLLPSTEKAKETHIPSVVRHAYRQAIAVVLLLDTPPLYPAAYFHEAANSVADKIDSLVTDNQGGVNVFVSYITHDSYPSNVLAFSIPAVPAYALAPVEPVYGNDPYKNATMKQAYQNALASYSQTITQEQNNLAVVVAQVRKETDLLRHLSPPTDNSGADVFGGLYTASQDLAHVTGLKYVVIASALVNNSTLQETNSLNLYGAVVRVIWRTCSVAATCEHDNTYWQQTMLHFGASSVNFYSVGYSEANHISF
jgi:hypothetical protein